MIKANEFRKGIFAIYKLTKAVVKFEEAQLRHLFLNENYEDYEPIPLTPEILESLGADVFHRHSRWMFPVKNFTIDIYANGSATIITSDPMQFFPLPELKHFHQLQNLIFTLTGQELEVKILELKPQ